MAAQTEKIVPPGFDLQPNQRTFSYLGGLFLFDLDHAERLVENRTDTVEVDEDSIRASLADVPPVEVPQEDEDETRPGIIAHVGLVDSAGTQHEGHVLIAGHALAARCLAEGIPFHAFVLNERESLAILARQPGSPPSNPDPDEVEEDATSRQAYADRFASSRPWSERSRLVIAGAATHDRRGFGPFGVYVDRAQGAEKWDLDGHPLIDFWMGHGALLCGHAFPPVMEAVARQLPLGTHFGANHPLEVRWAELVCRLIPSAQRVRFTASGTEATLLALRVARAFTGRNLVLKFGGHFHGWHDEAMAHFHPTQQAGFNADGIRQVMVGRVEDLEEVEDQLARYPVAAVLLEPGGGSAGGLPWSREMLQRLRNITLHHGTLLIFDEVISGFRHGPGGIQALTGVLPDLTTLAKILSGGLPGGALAGRADVMAVFGSGTTLQGRKARIPHTGTFNANPLSAAAGIALLEHIADGVAQEKARLAAEYLAAGVNRAADALDIDVFLFTNGCSIYHILIGARQAGLPLGPTSEIGRLQQTHPGRYALLRRALLLEGVDSHAVHGWVSAVHDRKILDRSIAAFGRAFERLRDVQGFRRPAPEGA